MPSLGRSFFSNPVFSILVHSSRKKKLANSRVLSAYIIMTHVFNFHHPKLEHKATNSLLWLLKELAAEKKEQGIGDYMRVTSPTKQVKEIETDSVLFTPDFVQWACFFLLNLSFSALNQLSHILCEGTVVEKWRGSTQMASQLNE